MHRLPYEAGEFARYLTDLCGRTDRRDGWCAIFWQRDPEGMRACLDGVEIPPWDVVGSLLQDLAAVTGAVYAEQETARARALHTAAATAHDRRPGGREALLERLELMRREEVYAKHRAGELLRLLSAEPGRGPEAERLTVELAWTRDDHARAMARIAELTTRLSRLDPPHPLGPPSGAAGVGAAGGSPHAGGHPVPDPGEGWGAVGASGPADAPHRPGRPSTAGASPYAGGDPAPTAGEPLPPHPLGPSSGAGGPASAAAAVSSAGAPGYAGGHPVPDPGEGRGAVGASGSDAAPHPLGPSSGAATPASAVGAAAGPGPGGPSHAVGAPSPTTDAPRPAGAPHPAVVASPATAGQAATAGAPAAPAKPAKARRRRGSARFAGVEEDGDGAVAVPVLPVAGDIPRGARYGGASPAPVTVAEPAPDPEEAVLAARGTVAALGRLRAEGRGGEAHVVLCEAAARPGAWLPALRTELERAGLGADWTTLLWEVASQPAARVAAAADALALAGRGDDGRLLLRQGVARPAGEIADTVMALEDEGMAPRAGALLAAYVEVRSAEDTARVAERDPFRLVPRLLAAARAVSPSRERDLIHALRVAGHLAA
ncbi:hypothetical protein ACFU9F_03580 [Streptomyces zhihengii]|uniref:hypothetical protein n=1 Tax=Streptomyces zhihengii TaxID=1818004 RepID=UPI00369097DA